MSSSAPCSFLRLSGGLPPPGKAQDTAGSATTHLLLPDLTSVDIRHPNGDRSRGPRACPTAHVGHPPKANGADSTRVAPASIRNTSIESG
eukprot:11343869-Alexandrium_andersonii.AAC.1